MGLRGEAWAELRVAGGTSQWAHLPAPTPSQSAVPFLILVALKKSNLIVTYVVAVAAGISVAAAFLLPW